MRTVGEQKLHRKHGVKSAGASQHTPISSGLRLAAERVPGLLERLAERTELLESALANAWQRRKRSKGEDSETREAELFERAASMGRRHDWDAIDEASWESFPASDPPAGWAGGDKKPSTH